MNMLNPAKKTNMGIMKSRKSGLILILVLWIMFFLSVTVVSLSSQNRMNIRLRSLNNENTRMFYLAKTGINRAVNILISDDRQYDSLDESWAQEISSEDQEAVLSVNIVDENSFLNINTVSEELLNNIGIIFPEITSEGIKAVIKNRPYNLKSEVKEILQLSDEEFYGDQLMDKFGLADFFTTFSNGKLNINTVPEHVLMLIPNMNEASAKAIINHRQTAPFTDNDAVSEELSMLGLTLAQISSLISFVQVESDCFRIKAKASSQKKHVQRNLETVLKRQDNQIFVLLAMEN
jgi:type II secretory pathway component PulK